jgi:quercetin dioxygenase-like cupin family protein
METKYNEATINRPEGDRIIDAPIVFMDLNKYSEQLRDEEAWQKNDRNSITIYKTGGTTMLLCWLKKDASITDNLANNHTTIQVMEGEIEVKVETGTLEVCKEQVLAIHPGILENIRAKEDSLLLISSKTDE